MSNDLSKILKIIDEEPARFNSKIPDIEKKVFREVSLLLKDLELSGDGKIRPTVENLSRINSIRGRLGKVLISKEYANLVKNFVSNLPVISNYQVANSGISSDSKKMITAVIKQNINNTLEGLIGAGYKQSVVSKLYNTLLTNVTSGGSYSEMIETLRTQLVSTEDKPGMLSKYAQTYVTDALGQSAGQGNKMIADALNSEWFQYIGSNLTTTREFCEHLTKKRYVHRSEIPTLLKGKIDGHQCEINKSTGLPKGMIAETNTDNFIVYRGGWNCGHELIPVSKVSIPKNIRDRFESNIENVELEKNNADIEQKIGVKKGKEMSFIEANEGRGNINYSKGGGYGVNCQSCVVANELRRRGFDVTAQPSLQKEGNIPYRLTRHTELAWIDPKTGKTPRSQTAGGEYWDGRKVKRKTIKMMNEELNELTKDTGRYHIKTYWKKAAGGGAHIFTAERLEGGSIRFYDPQTGKMVDWVGDWSKDIDLKFGVDLLRVDGLLVNADIVNGVVKKI